MFFLTNGRNFRTHTNQQAAYNSVYFNLSFRKQMGRKEIVDQMEADIPSI